MIFAHHEQERLGQQYLGGNTMVHHRQRHHREIEVALDDSAQEIGAKVLSGVDEEVGMGVAELGDQRRNQIRHNRLHGSNGDPSF